MTIQEQKKFLHFSSIFIIDLCICHQRRDDVVTHFDKSLIDFSGDTYYSI